MSLASSYRQQGFVVLRGLVPAALAAAVGRETAALVASPGEILSQANLRCRYKMHPETGAQLLDAIDPITDLLPAAREVASHAAVLDALATLYGEPARLFKDKLVLKPARAPGYPLHQDFIAWPFFPETFTTVMIAVDPSHEDNGCLELAPASHRGGYLSPRDGDFHDLSEQAYPPERRVKVPLEPGDAVIFGCFTVHGSGRNRSDNPRRHLYLSYNAASDGGDQRAAHYRYFHQWLRRRYEEYGAKSCVFL